ncbi:MAG: manganese efflux pump MntP family protein [Thermoplasmatota archaeon]
MDLVYIFLVAGVLAIDAFVVSISCGISHSRPDFRFCTRLSLLFGSMQALLFGLGFLLGAGIEWLISSLDHYIAFALLSFVGGRMIFSSIRGWKKERECRMIGFRTLVVLSVATSIDAFAVGITFAVLDISIILSMVIIGIVTFMLSYLGVKIGDGLTGKYDKLAEIFAGLVLIGLGLRVLVQHLFGM